MSNVEDEDRWSWANEENKPLDEKTQKQTKMEKFKKVFTELFSHFQGFWVPILISVVACSIGIFFSGIRDKDIISYSMLIAVTVMILLYSWRNLAFSSSMEPHGETAWYIKYPLIFFKFLVATIPQTITVVQLAVIITIFTNYKTLIYSDTRQVPDVFQTFNWGLFVLMLGQIGMINWYLQKNVSLEQTFFQKSFLPIFVIIATISSCLMAELFVIIRHFLTDG